MGLPCAFLLQGFTFEDPGGWCTTAYFDVSTLASNCRLKTLDLQLVTWECEHCEGFELQALNRLTQLHSLNICIAAPAAVGAGSSGGSSGSSGSGSDGPELLLMLPLLKPARKVTISSSMRVVLRNSKVLARARIPGVLAQGIMLEEPLPQRPGNNSSSSKDGAQTAGKAGASTVDKPAAATAAAAVDTAGAGGRDQTSSSSSAAGAQCHAVQQYVRAPAHVVISALRELWPNMEVWQYTVKVPTGRGLNGMEAELCCQGAGRHGMQQELTEKLTTAMAGLVDANGGCGQSPRGFGLW